MLEVSHFCVAPSPDAVVEKHGYRPSIFSTHEFDLPPTTSPSIHDADDGSADGTADDSFRGRIGSGQSNHPGREFAWPRALIAFCNGPIHFGTEPNDGR